MAPLRKRSKGRSLPKPKARPAGQASPRAVKAWTPTEHLEQIRRESMPSILTLSMVRDNPAASLSTRAKASEVLLKLNPDLEVKKHIEAEVVHHHVVEIQQIEGLKSIMDEIAPTAIDTEFHESPDFEIDFLTKETPDEQASQEEE